MDVRIPGVHGLQYFVAAHDLAPEHRCAPSHTAQPRSGRPHEPICRGGHESIHGQNATHHGRNAVQVPGEGYIGASRVREDAQGLQDDFVHRLECFAPAGAVANGHRMF